MTNNLTTQPPNIPVSLARRLFITKQRLAGAQATSIMDVVRDIGCLQIDPISAVARSHQLVLFSRLGNYVSGFMTS